MITLPTATGSLYRYNMAALRQAVLQQRGAGSGGATLRVRVLSPHNEDIYVDYMMLLGNLYLVAIENKHGSFSFPDNPAAKAHGNQRVLGFSGSYNDLGRYKDFDDREGLSIGAINNAILHLSQWRTTAVITNRRKDQRGNQKNTPDAKSLLILVLIVSEALRFRDIWKTIANALDGLKNVPLTMSEIDRLVHRWDGLSRDRKWYEQLDIPNV